MYTDMKKSILWILGAVFLSILIPVVLAVELPAMTPSDMFQPITDLLASIIKMFADILNYIMGGAGLGELVFSRFLLFLLLVLVIFYPSKIIARQNTGIAAAISVIVSILGTRYLDDKIVYAMLLPYGALAVAATCLIPFILYGLLIESSDFPQWVKRVGWLAFFSVFIGLYTFRWKEIGSGVGLYGIFAIASLIAFVLVPKMEQWKLNRQSVKEGTRTVENEINALKSEREEKIKEYRRTPLNQRKTGMIIEINQISKRIKDLGRMRTKF